MAEPSPPPPSGKDPRIADASWLVSDEPKSQPVSAAPVPPVVAPPVGDAYSLEAVPEASAPAIAPAPIPHPATWDDASPEAETRRRTTTFDQVATVDQVWSRGAEWGGSIALLLVVGLTFLVLIVWSVTATEDLALPLLLLVAAVAALVLLSYPILITLERPVRMTPEQAVKDYFAALSHHFPHYRRMWLLLSSAGRISGHYASFEGFKKHWKRRLAKLRAGRAAPFTPLTFLVEEFHADKSAGRTTIDAKYTVNVFVRGRRNEGPIDSFPVETSLAKGPDRMWYLNKGTLPGERL
jgi:hypothetical protein